MSPWLEPRRLSHLCREHLERGPVLGQTHGQVTVTSCLKWGSGSSGLCLLFSCSSWKLFKDLKAFVS